MGSSKNLNQERCHHEENDDDDDFFGAASTISSDGEDDGQLPDCTDDASSDHRPPYLLPLHRSESCEPLAIKAEQFGRRGLSNYYQGKSQSFARLSEVRCLEDLRKKESPYKRRMKTSRSYAALTSRHMVYPRTIAKKLPVNS